MKTKSTIISRVKAIKEGVKIELLYSKEVIKRGTDNLFIDIIREFKTREK